MATYVLIHGAASDSWYWHLVVPELPEPQLVMPSPDELIDRLVEVGHHVRDHPRGGGRGQSRRGRHVTNQVGLHRRETIRHGPNLPVPPLNGNFPARNRAGKPGETVTAPPRELTRPNAAPLMKTRARPAAAQMASTAHAPPERAPPK